MTTVAQMKLSFQLLSEKNWDLFENLFGPHGACGNCWCMYYRLPPKDFKKGKSGDGNKLAMKDIVNRGIPSGILAVYKGEAVAWCAFAPRKDLIKLGRSRVHRPIDDQPVWSIPCIFIRKDFRKKGFSVRLLQGVIKSARQNGVKIIEAYPVIPTRESLPDSFAWVGLYKSFERAGFKIVDRTSPNRPMVRYYTDKETETKK